MSTRLAGDDVLVIVVAVEGLRSRSFHFAAMSHVEAKFNYPCHSGNFNLSKQKPAEGLWVVM